VELEIGTAVVRPYDEASLRNPNQCLYVRRSGDPVHVVRRYDHHRGSREATVECHLKLALLRLLHRARLDSHAARN
jgi:hypothetical protein